MERFKNNIKTLKDLIIRNLRKRIVDDKNYKNLFIKCEFSEDKTKDLIGILMKIVNAILKLNTEA